MRRIGVLTSGGDAPGLNAALRAVVRAAVESDVAVAGIQWGYEGLLDDDIVPLDRRSIVNIVHRGGTVIGTARSERFMTPEGRAEAIAVLERHGIDGLVVIGGDGTFRGADRLTAEGGPPTIGIPATIDNDVVGTDRTLGFDTAVNTALGAIDRIRDTSASHGLVHFVEVMGRHCGEIALASGLAGGAEAVLVPEIPVSIDRLAEQLGEHIAAGKQSSLIVVAEGAYAGGAHTVAAEVGERLQVDFRVTVLGHVQRGGAPTAADRTLGGIFGVESVGMLLRGVGGVSVGEVSGQVETTPFATSGSGHRALDEELQRVARVLA